MRKDNIFFGFKSIGLKISAKQEGCFIMFVDTALKMCLHGYANIINSIYYISCALKLSITLSCIHLPIMTAKYENPSEVNQMYLTIF